MTKAMNRSTIAVVGGALWLLAGSAIAVPLEQQVEAVAAHLQGVMDTSAQAIANPKAANVQMTTCHVRVVDAGQPATLFLYQEQSLAERLDKPYRQRFLQLSPSRYSQTVQSRSFRPANLAAWAGFCNKPEG
ncbi:chorismate mutase, partial [Leptolyngbya sp. FACHB-36]|uniref:CpcT/CpeT family chromophore lyase n=1 Tax=Leptolyngbya sp. FACHB-36 TaxID=2692808 RepID=UPI0018EF75DC|nr:chorismate mutase [Leptolyngbya sp. FACHB-36]